MNQSRGLAPSSGSQAFDVIAEKMPRFTTIGTVALLIIGCAGEPSEETEPEGVLREIQSEYDLTDAEVIDWLRLSFVQYHGIKKGLLEQGPEDLESLKADLIEDNLNSFYELAAMAADLIEYGAPDMPDDSRLSAILAIRFFLDLLPLTKDETLNELKASSDWRELIERIENLREKKPDLNEELERLKG